MARRTRARAKSKKAKSPLITQVRVETPVVRKSVFMDNYREMQAFGRQLSKAQGLLRKAKPDKEAPDRSKGTPERDESSKDNKETKSKRKTKKPQSDAHE